jgi:hypothetical protein
LFYVSLQEQQKSGSLQNAAAVHTTLYRNSDGQAKYTDPL